MKTIPYFLFAALLFLGLQTTGCKSSKKTSEPTKTPAKTMDESNIDYFKQNAKEWKAGANNTGAVGDEIYIQLETNPSTGYNWEIAYDTTTFEVKATRKFEKEANKGKDLMGAPLDMIWRAKLLKKDIGQLVFTYKRSFESGGGEVKTYNYTIQ